MIENHLLKQKEVTRMKKLVVLIVVVVIIGVVLSACSGRDLSTPSSRLVGHWRRVNSSEHSYVSEINPDTGEGDWTYYLPSSGEVVIVKYKILSEAPDGKTLTIQLIHPNPDVTQLFIDEFVIEEDGLTAKFLDTPFEYIDDKTEYEPEK